MNQKPAAGAAPIRERLLVLGVLAAALTLRVWALSAGVPHALGSDEPAIVGRALRILSSGSWNTHAFDYPTLVIYFQAFVAIGCYLWGAAQGAWSSLGELDVAAVYTSGRLVTALIGTATVWLTYRIGRDLDSGRLGLVAAAQLAVLPLHVRESHYVLTDVPVAALMALTLWLALRAARLRSTSSYAWAGMAAGLAAAAKYNGAVALVAIMMAWLLYERSAPDRARKACAALGAMAAAYLVTSPYTILDLPGFLNGFGWQLARFSRERVMADPPWLQYFKHLSFAGRAWLPFAGLGAVIVMTRRPIRPQWMILIGLALAYGYVLATHTLVFARYATPLLPFVCLLVAVPVVEAARLCGRVRAWQRWRAELAVLAFGTIVFTAGPLLQSVRWIGMFQRQETRQVAASWMVANLPRHARVAVESTGPTHLDSAGFDVTDVELLVDHPLDWYREAGVEFGVISSADIRRYGPFLEAGRVLFTMPATDDRWGPPVFIVRLGLARASR
jgi:4-amino-4-deoxy-L-arabinose transferase-like glycosyltransferase